MTKKTNTKRKIVYAFIDAANLFYGGEKSLGWKIDYKKLLVYLRNKFGVSRTYYYAGLDIGSYRPKSGVMDIENLLNYFRRKFLSGKLSQADQLPIIKYIARTKFFKKLDQFGYKLRLKPTKVFYNGTHSVKKANCDVDLTFDLMKYISQYDEVVILSGDGDFAPVLEYLLRKGKRLHFLARSERTAREIRQLAGSKFMDFNYLREQLKMIIKKTPI